MTKDRWGMLPLDEPRCDNCGNPLRMFEHKTCDNCLVIVVRGMNAVDRAVKAARAA